MEPKADINAIVCTTGLRNTGSCSCKQILGATIKAFYTTSDFEFMTKTSAQTAADWTTAIQNKYVYPLPMVLDVEDNSTEAGVYTGSLGRKIKSSNSIWGEKLFFDVTAFEYSRLFSFDGAKGRIFLVDIKGNGYGTSSNGTKIKGFEIASFDVYPYTVATGQGEIRRMAIAFELANYSEYTKDIVVFEAEFADELTGLVDVSLGSKSWTTYGCVVTVTRDCDGSGVTGLVAADFVLVDDAGAPKSISSITPVSGSAGSYTLAATVELGVDGYVLNLKAPALMTTKGYESTGPTTGIVTL